MPHPRIGSSPAIRRRAESLVQEICWYPTTCVRLQSKPGYSALRRNGRVYDANGNPVRRFGFHNLRHSLSTALLTEEREDLRTVQDMMRHSNSSTTLDLYTQSTMAQRITAQEKLLSRILPQNELVN